MVKARHFYLGYILLLQMPIKNKQLKTQVIQDSKCVKGM